MAKLEASQPSTSGLNIKTKSEVKMESNRVSEETQTEDDEIIELSVVFEGENKCQNIKSLQPFIRT